MKNIQTLFSQFKINVKVFTILIKNILWINKTKIEDINDWLLFINELFNKNMWVTTEMEDWRIYENCRVTKTAYWICIPESKRINLRWSISSFKTFNRLYLYIETLIHEMGHAFEDIVIVDWKNVLELYEKAIYQKIGELDKSNITEYKNINEFDFFENIVKKHRKKIFLPTIDWYKAIMFTSDKNITIKNYKEHIYYTKIENNFSNEEAKLNVREDLAHHFELYFFKPQLLKQISLEKFNFFNYLESEITCD